MFEELVRQEHSRIDSRAEKDKRGVDYVVGLINQNPGAFLTVFNRTPKQEMGLYRDVRRTIEELDKEATRVIGISVTYFDPEKEVPGLPEVKLGWAEFKAFCEDIKGKKPHSLKLTLQGRQVVDDYRQALGYVSVAEHRKIILEKYAKAFARTETAVTAVTS